MKKSGIFIVILFLLIGAGCQLIPGQATPTLPPLPATGLPQSTATSMPTALPLPSASATPLATATSLPPGQPLLLVSKELSETGDKPAYSLKVRYPQFSAPAGQGLKAFNSQAEKMANELMDAYRKNIKQSNATPDPNFYPSFMEMSYDVTNGIHGLLSIHYTVSEYWSGAAHPNSYTRILNFNLIQGKTIELKDLFLPGVNYIQALADYCSSDLKRQDRLEFPEGALPKPENYQNWNITPEGLLIYFDPYQVGPYAVGPSQVRIPFSAIKGIVDAQGPLAALLK